MIIFTHFSENEDNIKYKLEHKDSTWTKWLTFQELAPLETKDYKAYIIQTHHVIKKEHCDK